MNIEKVPTSLRAMKPPRQSTMASASEEAKFIVAANTPRRRAARTERRSMLSVSDLKSCSIRSSMTRVLTVFAPVMPSLKLPVIFELISRISRLMCTSFFWKIENSTTSSGRIASTSSASFALTMSIATIAPTT